MLFRFSTAKAQACKEPLYYGADDIIRSSSMTDSPIASTSLQSPPPALITSDSLSQAAFSDINDMLTRPPHRHSSRKPQVHSKGSQPASLTSLSPDVSLQASFAPKTIRLEEVKNLYDKPLRAHKQVTPPFTQRSVGSRNRHRFRESPPRLSHFHTARESSGSPFPAIQRPRGFRNLVPVRSKQLIKASKSPPTTFRKHQRSVTNVDVCRSPYDIRFVQPTIRKSFHLLVDINLKPSTRPELIVRKAGHRKVLSSREKDQKVFKMLSSLLA